MKKIPVVKGMLLGLALSAAGHAAGPNEVEKGFLSLYAAKDEKARMTAYLLTAEIHSDTLRKFLQRQVKSKGGAERTVMLYVLGTPSASESEKQEFLRSFAADPAYMQAVLAIDAGERSLLLGPPRLHVLQMLGALAVHHDRALEQLVAFYRASDGWVAEALFSLLEEAREQRVRIELHRIKAGKGK